MSDIAITYKNNTIAQMSASGTKTLLTTGKFCTDDITINYLRPSADPTDALVVPVKWSGYRNQFYLDKTYAQLKAAVNNEKTLIASVNYPLSIGGGADGEIAQIAYRNYQDDFVYYVMKVQDEDQDLVADKITYYGYTLDNTDTITETFKIILEATS